MVRLKPDKSNPENEAYWKFVRETTREVNDWPDWKKPNQPPQTVEAGQVPQQPVQATEKVRD